MSTRTPIRATAENIHHLTEDVVVFESVGAFGGRVYWVGPATAEDIVLRYEVPDHDRLDMSDAVQGELW